MTKQQAINLNPNTASIDELRKATIMLKASYTKSSQALERRGLMSELMHSMKAREELGLLNTAPITKLDLNTLKSEFVAYRDYAGHRVYDNNDVFIGFAENKTATASGYMNWMKDVAENVLGYKEYKNLSQNEQSNLWAFINDVRSTIPSYFQPGSGAYGSSDNIKKITQYYLAGYTKEEAINLLTGSSTITKMQEEAERAMRVETSPMFLVNQDNF